MLLVNGSEGIGTGWSTYIPPFNPLDLVDNIRNLMAGRELNEMHPWYKGWKGTMEKVENQRYRMYGRIEQVGPNKLEITELPAKTWTTTIKEYLLVGLGGNEKTKSWIKDMEEQHTHDIKFIITLTDEEMKKTKKIGFYERFKLISPISMQNMVAFDPRGKIKRYENVNEILTDFYYVRLEYYQKRKDFMSERLQWEVEKLSYQVKFIKMIIDKELVVTNKARVKLIQELEDLGFPRINKHGKPHYGSIDDETALELNDEAEAEDEEKDEDEVDANGDTTVNGPEEIYGTYEYLLGMRIWSLTKERYERLLKQKQEKEIELEELLKLSASDLWNNDLDDFLDGYEQFMALDEQMRSGELVGSNSKAKGKRKRKADDDEYDPSKKTTRKRRTTKKIKLEDSNFERVLIKPKAVTKRVTKIKAEAKSSTPSSTATPSAATSTVASTTTSKASTPEVSATPLKIEENNGSSGPSTIFDGVGKKEDDDASLSSFSSKFKKISAAFDKMDGSSNDSTPDSAPAVKLEDRPKKTTPAPKKKPAARAKKVLELSDESDLEILSDNANEDDDDDDSVFIQPRKRTLRTTSKAKSYGEGDLLSEDSFVEDTDSGDSDNSFIDDDD